MKISVIGCGYLGAVHAACMAKLGHDVVGVDVDERKVETLNSGKAPFFEPGLPELLEAGLSAGRLRFTTDFASVADATVHFVAVGTPQSAGSKAADLRFVDAAVNGLVPFLSPGHLVVGKSTVPVGTAERLAKILAPTGSDLAWNPEFLREGFAVEDTISPDRLVYGVASGERGEEARRKLDEVYSHAIASSTPRVVTDYATSELVKVAANAFLATKISFINAMAEISDVVGGNVTELADAIGYDDRIGRKFLRAGIGFGGGCLPKDIRAFMARAEELGTGESVSFLKEIDAINLRRRDRVVEMAEEFFPAGIAKRKVAILGLAFKPNSDDIRDSPALDVASRLSGIGADVFAHDPEAMDNARIKVPEIRYESLDVVLDEADVVLLLTEWDVYKQLDPAAVGNVVKTKAVIDGRNVLDPGAWRAEGWTYKGMGR